MDRRFFIDCEFDGHNGPLLSMAIVAAADGFGCHITTTNEAKDLWVLENVVPLMGSHEAHIAFTCSENEIGDQLRHIIQDTENPIIVADSVVDIARFCKAISTNEDGGWASIDGDITFEVHDIACYPTQLAGAVQHNAWWDAMSLCDKLL